MLLVKKDLCHLRNLPAGSLFMFNNTLCLKSEYRNVSGVIEAYIVGSGEMFWGGTNSPEEQSMLLVNEVEIIETPEFVDGVPYVPFPIAFHTVDVIALNNNKILLGRKPKQEKWQFIGGFVEPTHTAEMTASKEFSEEAGLLITNLSRFKYLTSLFIDDERYKNSCHKITSSIFTVVLKDDEIKKLKAGDDIEELAWFTLDTVYENLRDQHKGIFVKYLTKISI